jgi:hypothetical protein
MALKITVSTGKQELPRTSAGLIKRTSEEGPEKAHVSVSEIVSSIFDELRTTIEGEADVEISMSANVEIATKDGVPNVNLDISGESANSRTLNLKFSTKLNPREKDSKEAKD